MVEPSLTVGLLHRSIFSHLLPWLGFLSFTQYVMNPMWLRPPAPKRKLVGGTFMAPCSRRHCLEPVSNSFFITLVHAEARWCLARAGSPCCSLKTRFRFLRCSAIRSPSSLPRRISDDPRGFNLPHCSYVPFTFRQLSLSRQLQMRPPLAPLPRPG